MRRFTPRSSLPSTFSQLVWWLTHFLLYKSVLAYRGQLSIILTTRRLSLIWLLREYMLSSFNIADAKISKINDISKYFYKKIYMYYIKLIFRF